MSLPVNITAKYPNWDGTSYDRSLEETKLLTPSTAFDDVQMRAEVLAHQAALQNPVSDPLAVKWVPDSGNAVSGTAPTIAGGTDNTADADFSVVVGGTSNEATGLFSVITGGVGNTAGGRCSSIVGGRQSTAGGSYSGVAAGYYNTASASYAFIGGGGNNSATSEHATVGGGIQNLATNVSSTIAGGQGNQSTGLCSSVVGGKNNIASGDYSGVLSGYNNTASNEYSTVSGGSSNTASGPLSIVLGGSNNTASGNTSIASGLNSLADRYGMKAWSTGSFSNPGDAQQASFILSATTNSATPTILGLNGQSIRLTIPIRKILAVNAHIVGVTSTGGVACSFNRKAAIKNVGGTVSLVGSVSTIGTDITDNGALATTITANNTDKSLDISVTGLAATNIRWLAFLQGVEMEYASE